MLDNYLTENILKHFRKINIEQISNKKEYVRYLSNRKYFEEFSKDNY